MRESRTALATLLGLALVGCAGAPESTAPSPPRAERPTYELGEKWIRDDGIYELTRIEEGRYVFAGGPRREVHLTRDLVVWEVTRGPSFVAFVSPPALSWPLQVGQRSTIRGRITAYGILWVGNPFNETTLTVDAYEDVRVPAGTFKAFRISGVTTTVTFAGPAPWGGHVFRTWYAPEARQLVKGESATFTPLNFQVVAVERRDRTGRASSGAAPEEPVDSDRARPPRL